MALLCFHALVTELVSSRNLSRSISTSLHEHEESFASSIPPTAECPLFVTWDKRKVHSRSEDFRLRGCIGTLSPRPLSTSITEYALTSALRDRRFDPIKLHEVPYLRVAISLLVRCRLICGERRDDGILTRAFSLLAPSGQVRGMLALS